MKNSFIFDGVDMEHLGLEYAPELSQTYVYGGAQIKNHEDNFDGADGGYYYGYTVQPKDFKQRCIFEGSHINKTDMMMRIEGLFRKGRTGKLIFKNRPWCYYVATVMASVSFSDLRSYQSGIQTINLRAHYPFARSDQKFIGTSDVNKDSLLAHTGMFIQGDVPVDFGVRYSYYFNSLRGSANPVREYIVYNPGTEYADVALELSGNVADGLEIINETTGDMCRIIATTRADTTIAGRKIVIDGLNGKCYIIDNNRNYLQDAYISHDEGFIRLAPCTPFMRNCQVRKKTGLNSTNLGFEFVKEMPDGSYEPDEFFANDDWASGDYHVILNADVQIGNNTVRKQELFRINGVHNNNSAISVDRLDYYRGSDNTYVGNISISNGRDVDGTYTQYTMDDFFGDNEVINVSIMKMNRITLRKNGETLTEVYLDFKFKPTFA